MARRCAAGLLMYRRRGTTIEVLLAHPGGPLFVNKDHGHWSIPKGEYTDDEAPLDAARREFHEETGWVASGPFIDLGSITQAGGKVVHAWACAGDGDAAHIVSNEFEMEWPPRSGRLRRFPEVDRCGFFSLDEAALRIKPAQIPLLEALRAALAGHQPRPA